MRDDARKIACHFLHRRWLFELKLRERCSEGASSRAELWMHLAG
jgi:hypothetical protein